MASNGMQNLDSNEIVHTITIALLVSQCENRKMAGRGLISLLIGKKGPTGAKTGFLVVCYSPLGPKGLASLLPNLISGSMLLLRARWALQEARRASNLISGSMLFLV